MSLEQVGFLVENFKTVGYTKCKIVTIEPEVVEPKEVSNVFETAEKIEKALKED
jgi:hypothetical protein